MEPDIVERLSFHNNHFCAHFCIWGLLFYCNYVQYRSGGKLSNILHCVEKLEIDQLHTHWRWSMQEHGCFGPSDYLISFLSWLRTAPTWTANVSPPRRASRTRNGRLHLPIVSPLLSSCLALCAIRCRAHRRICFSSFYVLVRQGQR